MVGANTMKNWQHPDSAAGQNTNAAVRYPDYQVPFHAYEQGNLCWEAAFEAESATHAMALRI